MASLYSLLNFMGVSGFQYSDPGSFDIINSLPLEVAVIVLRSLSGKDLLNAASVNTKWFNICKSDSKLRQKIRKYLRQKRKADIAARLFGNSSRYGLGHGPTTSGAMNNVNIRNTTNLQQNRLPVEPSTPRYMPYRREASFGNTRVSSTKRASKRVRDNNHARYNLRM